MSTWKYQLVEGGLITDDIPTCFITYCCPCITYGQNATAVHGGDCVMHALKYYLYSCFCGCGLVAGPTRKTVRDKFGLPQQPAFLAGDEANSDCIVHTVPCVACFAHCQEAAELKVKGITSTNPIAPSEFTWGPAPAASTGATATVTAAPAQEAAPAK
eukprot:scaffold17.g530.t1